VLFRQLEYLVALANEQHFARAAAATFVSQPALSSAVAKLEQELDVSLIYRDRSFQGLTPEGERLVIWARRILAEHDAFKAEVQAVQGGITGTLRLGVISTASTTVALAVEAFAAAHPLAHVQLQSRLPSAELARRLRDFELDAAITYDDDNVSGLELTPLYVERYVVIAAPSLVTGLNSEWSWEEAVSLPLAMLTPETHSRQVVDSLLTSRGLTIAPRVETDSVASLYALVSTGRWASIVPHSWLSRRGPADDVRMLPLRGSGASSQVVVAINPINSGSRIARAFVSAAADLDLNALLGRQLVASDYA
jgi:DNA-binding transcriptional LysR family regulator